MTVKRTKNDHDYIAFVSYSHNDARWASWLHRGIETYRLPRGAASGRERRVGRLFLDRSELATSADLSVRIQEAMDRSANLLVVCSPAARHSRWVNEEVRRFRDAGKGDRIFCLVVAGDPASDGEDGCFPPALLAPLIGKTPIEPLAADVRPGKDRPADARLKLIAGLLDLPFDALRRRAQARRHRLLLVTTIASLLLLAVMTTLTIAAVLSRNEAARQRDVAQRTVTFLSELFDGARPESASGRDVSVREMVDRAAVAAVASPDLRREPAVRATLLTTLADVYAKLRLPAAGRRLVREAGRYPIEDRRTALYRATVDADLQTIAADYSELKPTLEAAFAAIGDDEALRREFGAPLLMARGQMAQAEDRPLEAERDYAAARRLAMAGGWRPMAVSALLAAAVADVDNGRVDRAEQRLRRVIAERRALGQTLDPDILTAYNSLGTIAIKRGDPAGAERWFRDTLALQVKVYGPASLDVALSRSNLGRALVEQRRFTAARDALLAARIVYLREVGDRADVLANLEDSLGLALGGMGENAAAAQAFARGLVAARANGMAKEVELLTDLAEVRCREPHQEPALRLLRQARMALANSGLSEPWRSARIDNVVGDCLLRMGKMAEAAPLLAKSAPAVIRRWGANSLFGQKATERSQRARHRAAED